MHKKRWQSPSKGEISFAFCFSHVKHSQNIFVIGCCTLPCQWSFRGWQLLAEPVSFSPMLPTHQRRGWHPSKGKIIFAFCILLCHTFSSYHFIWSPRPSMPIVVSWLPTPTSVCDFHSYTANAVKKWAMTLKLWDLFWLIDFMMPDSLNKSFIISHHTPLCQWCFLVHLSLTQRLWSSLLYHQHNKEGSHTLKMVTSPFLSFNPYPKTWIWIHRETRSIIWWKLGFHKDVDESSIGEEEDSTWRRPLCLMKRLGSVGVKSPPLS